MDGRGVTVINVAIAVTRELCGARLRQNGAETNVPGFGKFKVKETPAREGRNPGTGETIKIAASRKLTFASAKAVKDALNG